jgi:serine/threonine protein kinase/ankyrin repeat protein
LGDLLLELRILSHRPLQRHPNIVHVLGFAWIQDRQFFTNTQELQDDDKAGEPREWPTIVTPKAPHGSLRTFMGSEKFRTVLPSLRTKLMLSVHVLCGLKVSLGTRCFETCADRHKALHECDIIHGDIKCDNVLIYDDSTSGTAENWQAKIADFSHSVVLNEEKLSQKSFVGSIIRGTKLYNPPEVVFNRPFEDWQSLKYADIWSFGLLVLEVLLDGDVPRTLIGKYQQSTAGPERVELLEHCHGYLLARHPIDQALVEVGMATLESCLHQEPLSRADARGLLVYLKDKMKLSLEHDLLPTSYDPKTLTPLEELPFFDLNNYYYDLLATLTVPGQVFNGLKSVVECCPLQCDQNSPQSLYRLRAEFQLGLCYASSFGVQSDYKKAIAHTTNAARGGLQEAQVLAPKIHFALDNASSSVQVHEFLSWLESAWRSGSVAAMQDYQTWSILVNPATIPSLFVAMQPRESQSRHLLELPSLHAAVLHGNIHDAVHRKGPHTDVNTRGVCGEIALHYTICLPVPIALEVAKGLLDHGANVFQATTAPIAFSEHNISLNEIDAGMTPLHLALSYDHIELFKLFLAYCHDNGDQRLWDSSNGILRVAARYTSVRCLEYLCTDPRWANYTKLHVNDFDEHQFSAMYHAIRPHFFDRMYRVSPRDRTIIEASPVVNAITTKELRIYALLRLQGATIQIHKHDAFNIFHLLSSFGEPGLLDQLLSDDQSSHLKDEKSEFGWTPLKDAIARGRYEAYRVLLKHNVKTKNIWAGYTGNFHALHVCSSYRGSLAERIADEILANDPRCLHATDIVNNTPLHVAAMFGNIKIIRLFDRYNAQLYVVNRQGFTPLGIAVFYRMTAAVHELRRIHQKRSQPEISIIWGWRTVHPIEQLLTPGYHPTTRDMVLMPHLKFGACDHPFSVASLNLLQSLLETFPTRTKFGLNFGQNLLYDPVHTSGIYAAVRMANIEAVRLLLDTFGKHSMLDTWKLRRLLFEALDQLSMNEFHIASEEARKLMADEIWIRCESHFTATKNRRLEQGTYVTVSYWKLYYFLYGNMEHHQLSCAKQWLQRNPLERWYGNQLWVYHVPTEEFQPLHDIRVSYSTLNMLLLVLLQIATMVCLIVIASDPSSRWNPTNSAWAATSCVLVSEIPLNFVTMLTTDVELFLLFMDQSFSGHDHLLSRFASQLRSPHINDLCQDSVQNDCPWPFNLQHPHSLSRLGFMVSIW